MFCAYNSRAQRRVWRDSNSRQWVVEDAFIYLCKLKLSLVVM